MADCFSSGHFGVAQSQCQLISLSLYLLFNTTNKLALESTHIKCDIKSGKVNGAIVVAKDLMMYGMIKKTAGQK